MSKSDTSNGPSPLNEGWLCEEFGDYQNLSVKHTEVRPKLMDFVFALKNALNFMDVVEFFEVIIIKTFRFKCKEYRSKVKLNAFFQE